MRCLPGLVVLVLGAAAQAEAVHRCGPDGRSFSQWPCRDGRGARVDVRDPVDAATLAEARAVVAREQAAGDAMAAQRRAVERRAVTRPSVIPFDRLSARQAPPPSPPPPARGPKAEKKPPRGRARP